MPEALTAVDDYLKVNQERKAGEGAAKKGLDNTKQQLTVIQPAQQEQAEQKKQEKQCEPQTTPQQHLATIRSHGWAHGQTPLLYLVPGLDPLYVMMMLPGGLREEDDLQMVVQTDENTPLE